MLDMFRNEYTPETLPYHLVVLSLPGYTFSSPPPLDKDFCIEDIARVFTSLVYSWALEMVTFKVEI